MDTETSQAQQLLSLSAAAKVAGVSVVTLRKHLKAGVLEAQQATTKHGATWQIAPDTLASFVADRYGRQIDVSQSFGDDPETLSGSNGHTPESLVALRQQLDDTLVELGRYRALTEKAESTSAEVERLLKERIAEVTTERDQAREELDRLKSRGFWARLFGGNT